MTEQKTHSYLTRWHAPAGPRSIAAKDAALTKSLKFEGRLS